MAKKTNDQLLDVLCEVEGFEDQLALLKHASSDSVVPGICTDCEAAHEVEPDQTAGWCDECGKPKVKSCLILAGLI